MYVLNTADICQFNRANAPNFVEFWSQFYKETITVFGRKEKIDYFNELQRGNDLTEENIRRLLRWKDPKYLSQTILSGPQKGRENDRVTRVLGHRDSINDYRKDRITQEQMRLVAEQIFPSGIVWKALLLHVAKPHIHPIADDNVFRVYSLHTGEHCDDSWKSYEKYSAYFGQIAESMDVEQKPENITKLKQIDNALVVFGRFLKAYHQRPVRSD